ncbi:hypothetical protein MSG28_006392 [Choristoneura fumiferana]|uniref:Uncharacterized protein n=1 Tax=Choristoneura fumiferana TaxID=7141 RepID=A0ACC0JEU1_CHOFU|nr:hypothetical protein MSG28_006392 [Choristoneura fumiferana]
MSVGSHISLVDLSKQFPFQIDETIKAAICFGETLIISCGHYEGEVDGSSDSEWSCFSSTESQESIPPVKDNEQKKLEVKEKVEEEAVEEENGDDEHDFHFYFFPDCTKPLPPANSKASVLVGPDGFPVVNPVAKGIQFCTCYNDKAGKCDCFAKLPCYCGAKAATECTCGQLETICICDEFKPTTVCECKSSEVCVCHPENKPYPTCTCDQVDKPCFCHPGKFPTPICACKRKRKKPTLDDIQSEGEENESEITEIEAEQEPCDCQKPEPKDPCLCLKGKVCICKPNMCICGVQKNCLCDPAEGKVKCKDQVDKLICSCEVSKQCLCDKNSPEGCKCYPKPPCCTCGNAEDCACFTVCECAQPCLCDTQPEKKECVCLDTPTSAPECTCTVKQDQGLKLKKKRIGKHGYRWCHDVDPRHTYFDYAYDRHDKISYKEQEREKLKILGLYDEKEEAETWMSINVECLGEDKDKFLVQVVSHSSKEGAKAGTKLVSILDMNLHTMEENRTEHITQKDLTKERRSYMAICENGYYNKVTRICGEQDVVKRFYHNFEDARLFLLEGANVVLLRYFGLSRYRGNIRTETVMMNGTICESIYVCHGVSQAIVNGKSLFVCKVERHIIEPNGILHQTLSVLTLRGYLVSHEWANNSYIIHINPLLNIVPEKDLIEPHVPLRENWREDLQLLSDYLDFKSTRTSEGGRYVSESGALTNTVRDYLQALLMLRPQDALHFTRHYFGSALSALDLPHDEYFDSCNKHVRYYFFED